jgi:hypothetical protein
MEEYAFNVLKRRAEEQQTKNAPKLTHLRRFSAMIQNAYAPMHWTPQALREFYIELEDLLGMLKSQKIQETDEAIITIFGAYSTILKNIRKSANSNVTPHPTTVQIVKNVIPPKWSTYPHESFIWRILGYTYDVANYSAASEFSKGVDYFIHLVAKEAVNGVRAEKRTQVTKYDMILAIEKVKKDSMKTFIDAKKTNAEAAEPATSPATSEIDWKNQAQLAENELERCRQKVRYYRNKCKIAAAASK